MLEPTDQPIRLDTEHRKDIAEKMATCPFVGTAVASGLLQVLNTPDHPLASIDDVARLGDTGGGNLGTHVLTLFARGNHSRMSNAGDMAGLVPPGTFNLQFGGSKGAHPGHSGILLGNPREVGRGRLDPEQFRRLEELADENGRLSIDTVGDFIAENVKKDPDAQVLPVAESIRNIVRLLGEFKDVALGGDERERTEAFEALTTFLGQDHLAGSAGEWALLFTFLKNSPNSNNGDIALAEVKMMFVDKRFPEGWDTWKKDTFDWIKATFRLTNDAAFAYHFGWK